MKTGTHTIADLSANAFAKTTVAEYGVEKLNDAIQADLDVHNERTTQMLGEMCEVSPERSTIYGTNAQGEAVRKDEFTRGPTQKITRGSKVEFPLDSFQYAVGWTADYLRRATVQDMALKTIAARQAHLRQIQRDIKEALFGPLNYTWTDRLVDGNDLAVKRLVNADSGPIPNGPNGEAFDPATHSHYDAFDWNATGRTAQERADAISALLQDVVEHGHGADARIYINRAQETDFRALPGFDKLPPPNIEFRATDTAVGRLDTTKVDNRLIGYFNGTPVWTKPWVPASYVLAFSAGDPQKPLRFRVSKVPGESGLFVAGEIITHPLQAKYMEFVHGVGVLNRTNGAILYLGGTVYAAPNFTT